MVFDLNRKSNQRGQIALEFMLLLVFILVFISSTVIPSVDLSGQTAQEVERLGEARIAAESISSTASQLFGQGTGAKQTILVFVPEDANILCDSSAGIGFQFSLGSIPASACELDSHENPQDPMRCTRFFPVEAETLECATGDFPLEGKQIATIVVRRITSPETKTRVEVE